MKRFVEGQSRTQGALLPESLDDFVAEANPVRVIDVFVDELDLRKLGFTGVDPAATGRPALFRAWRGCAVPSEAARQQTSLHLGCHGLAFAPSE